MTAPEGPQHDGARAIAEAVRGRKRSAVEVTGACLQRIAEHNDRLNCFHEVFTERALEVAEAIDGRVAAGEDPGALAGVPVAVKDNIATAYGHTTCSSRFLQEYRSPFSATAVQRLEAAGAVVIGKTNCDEFAMGSSSEHCAFGPVRNPWDTDRVPGGSSGGSAAAVAAGLCPVAVGSDTGGSIRQPAALCGCVGVKPTYGRVSRFGLVAFGSSLDQVGPLARNVGDAALVLSVIAGADPRDSTCADAEVANWPALLEEPIEGLRLGVPAHYRSGDNDPAVNEAVERAAGVFEQLGAEIVQVDLPLTPHGLAAYYVIAPAEASSNLARYDGVRYGRRAALPAGATLEDLYAASRAEGFGPEVQRRVMLGTYVLSAGYHEAYYKRALQVRRLVRRELDAAFEHCHALLGPTSPTAAFPIGAKADPLSMYLCDLYTVGASIAGICGISLPAGFADAGGGGFGGPGAGRLPVGVQIQCRAFDETTMFRVARLLERATDLHAVRAPL